MKTLLLFALLLVAGTAFAATATLQWNASIPDATHGAATGYKIYKGTDSTCTQAGPLTTVIATLGNVLAYTDTNVTGTTVCYEISGTNSAGEGGHSLRMSAVVPVNPPQAPLNPRVTVAP